MAPSFLAFCIANPLAPLSVLLALAIFGLVIFACYETSDHVRFKRRHIRNRRIRRSK